MKNKNMPNDHRITKKTIYERELVMRNIAHRLACTVIIYSLFSFMVPHQSIAINAPLPSSKLDLGKNIPTLLLVNTLTEQEREYLGIRQKGFSLLSKKQFALKDIQAEFILLEFLNRYCVSCLTQSLVLDSLYHKMQADPFLRHRVKILAIGVGNNEREVQQFREEKNFSFPMIPDPDFMAYDAIGDPGGTPYYLIVRKTPEGQLLTESHLGLVPSEEQLFQKFKDLISFETASLQLERPKDPGLEGKKVNISLTFTEKEIQEKIIQSIRRNKDGAQLQIKKIDLPEYGPIYLVESSQESGWRWFARIYTRSPICDVCHPVHFLIIFDHLGVVMDLHPLHVTKYGNIPLASHEVTKLRERVVGRDLGRSYNFQPEYDSVTGATISISLIFNSLNKSSGLFRKLKEEGYILKK